MTPRPVRLLFVCVGNTCRSPLAAAVASAVLGSRVHAESAGMAATGRPAAAEARAVLQERCGLDRSTHRSRPLRAVTLAESSRVIALDPSVYATRCQLGAIPPPYGMLWPLDAPLAGARRLLSGSYPIQGYDWDHFVIPLP